MQCKVSFSAFCVVPACQCFSSVQFCSVARSYWPTTLVSVVVGDATTAHRIIIVCARELVIQSKGLMVTVRVVTGVIRFQ